MPVTIKDLSKHLGLSTSTVSKALNGYPDISAETRALVLAASRDLGYHPNAVARNLRRRRSDKIGIVHPVKAFESEILMGFFQGLAFAAQTRRYNLVLYTAPAGDADALKSICRSQEVDGMILMGASLAGAVQASIEMLQAEGMPFVVLGHPVEAEGVTYIASDNRAGVNGLMRHLLELGHERIAYIGRSDDPENHEARLAAFLEALEAARLPLPSDYLADAPYAPYSGMSAMRALLELPQPPSAVLAFNDHIAIDACRTVVERGLRVPHDVAVAGYGNVPSSLITTPPITTSALPLRAMGEAALETLLQLLGPEAAAAASRVFPTRLLVRASTLAESG